MAGKSTFLRGIGVNAVLAQSGAPVRAVKSEAFAVGSHRLHLRSGFARGRHLALLCRDPSAEADHGPDQRRGAGSFSAGRVALGNKLARSLDWNPIVRHQTGGTGRGGLGEHARPGTDRDSPGDRTRRPSIATSKITWKRGSCASITSYIRASSRPAMRCLSCAPLGLKSDEGDSTHQGSLRQGLSTAELAHRLVFHQAFAGDVAPSRWDESAGR